MAGQYDHRGGRFSASNGVEVGSHASARVGLLSRNIIVRPHNTIVSLYTEHEGVRGGVIGLPQAIEARLCA
jgi:hypothetical protein